VRKRASSREVKHLLTGMMQSGKSTNSKSAKKLAPLGAQSNSPRACKRFEGMIERAAFAMEQGP